MLNKGFTLIELMISLTIMMLLLGGGLASYINFNEKQQLLGSAKEVQTYLRSAQSKARAGEVPDGCDHLEGYLVQANSDASVLNLSAVCENDDFEIREYQLNTAITFDDPVNITFLSLTGGVEGAQTVSLSSSDRTYQFRVTQGGEISQGDLVE